MKASDEPTVNPPAPASVRRVPPVSASVPVSGRRGCRTMRSHRWGCPRRCCVTRCGWRSSGRTSTEDQKDPRQSLMRQLGNSKAAIPESWVIVAHFYDVESGRMELDARGRGENYDRFDIPISRDGGVADLLDEAAHPGRRFDVVISESIARVARRAFEGLSVERELERAEVPLFASNEPITLSRSRAQRILQRRINQSVAEYEVLNTLEQSWGGLCTHVREGWNIGKPCYGYKAKPSGTPIPSRRPEGRRRPGWNPTGQARKPSPRSPSGATKRESATTPSPSGSTPTPVGIRRRSRPVGRGHAGRGARPASTRSCATRSTPASGVQPACVSLPERQGQRPGQVGVVARADARAADPEVDVRRAGRAPPGQTRFA